MNSKTSRHKKEKQKRKISSNEDGAQKRFKLCWCYLKWCFQPQNFIIPQNTQKQDNVTALFTSILPLNYLELLCFGRNPGTFKLESWKSIHKKTAVTKTLLKSSWLFAPFEAWKMIFTHTLRSYWKCILLWTLRNFEKTRRIFLNAFFNCLSFNLLYKSDNPQQK